MENAKMSFASESESLCVQNMLTGSEAIAKLLLNHNLDKIFAYPGTSELPLCTAIVNENKLALVNSRGDKEAAFMAAGGNLGPSIKCAAILHGARGLTNALGAVAEVRRDEIPVLYIVGMPSRSSAQYLPPHGEHELIDSAGAFAKASFDCSKLSGYCGEEFVDLVVRAINEIYNLPYGPVLLGVPQDLLSKAFVPKALIESMSGTSQNGQSISLDRALQSIKLSKNRVILVDDYIFRSSSEIEHALADIAKILSASVLQLSYRRGPMLFQQIRAEKVPNYVGQYDPTNNDLFGLLHSADLLITIEDRNMYPRVIGPLPSCAKLVITSNRDAVEKNEYVQKDDVLLVGDVSSILLSISNMLKQEQNMHTVARSFKFIETKKCSASARQLITALTNGFNRSSQPLLIDDSQMFGGLIAANYELLPSGTRVFGSHGGFVGSGLAIATGTAVANENLQVICTLGDQGFTNSVQALAVAGERQIPFLIIVCNNGSSVSLRKQSAYESFSGIDAFLANNQYMNYSEVAKAFGLGSTKFYWPSTVEVTKETMDASAQLSKIVTELLVAGKPQLLELVVPGDVAFWQDIWSCEGLEQLSHQMTANSRSAVPVVQ